MAWNVTEFAGAPNRTLVCESGRQKDLAALRAKAEQKGWSYLADGLVPETGRHGLWLTKAAESPVSVPPSQQYSLKSLLTREALFFASARQLNREVP